MPKTAYSKSVTGQAILGNQIRRPADAPSLDVFVDRIVAEVKRGRPRNGLILAWPDRNGRCIPFRVLEDDGKRFTSTCESSPLRSENLKDQVTGEKSEYVEFEITPRFCWGIGFEVVAVEPAAPLVLPLKGSEPDLKTGGRNGQRGHESFPSSRVKKRVAVEVGMVSNYGALKRENGK